MAYTPNPYDATQPVDSVFASTAAAEFRALKLILSTLSGASSYIGVWSTLTGAVAAGKVVAHSSTLWMALEAIPDVTLSEPGVALAWVDIGSVKRAGDTMLGHLNAIAGASGTQVPQAQETAMLATTQFGFRNCVVNGNFSINQGGVSGSVVLAAGAYGHDQWKAGAAGCTYTFSASGGVNTLNITEGSLIQPIEGVSLRTGTYTLSWTGTAQGKIGAGAYSASGVTGSVTGGADTTIEFNTGTLSLVQLERGDRPTVFEFLDPTSDFQRCARFYWVGSVYWTGQATSAGRAGSPVRYPVPMRATPTFGSYVSTVASGFPASTPAQFNQSRYGVTLDLIANATVSDGRWAGTFTMSARI